MGQIQNLPINTSTTKPEIKNFWSNKTQKNRFMHLFFSRLDYCNGILTALRHKSVRQLQLIQKPRKPMKWTTSHWSLNLCTGFPYIKGFIFSEWWYINKCALTFNKYRLNLCSACCSVTDRVTHLVVSQHRWKMRCWHLIEHKSTKKTFVTMSFYYQIKSGPSCGLCTVGFVLGVVSDWNERGRVEHRLKFKAWAATLIISEGLSDDKWLRLRHCLSGSRRELAGNVPGTCLSPVWSGQNRWDDNNTGFNHRVETVNLEFTSVSGVLVAQREASDAT